VAAGTGSILEGSPGVQTSHDDGYLSALRTLVSSSVKPLVAKIAADTPRQAARHVERANGPMARRSSARSDSSVAVSASRSAFDGLLV